MVLPRDWRTDPVVLIEGEVIPVLTLAPQLLCALALGQDVDAPRCEWDAAVIKACDTLDCGAATFLEPAGFPLTAEGIVECRKASAILREFGELVQRTSVNDPSALEIAHEDLVTRVDPALNSVLDTIRGHFISSVLIRQAEHADRSSRAIEQLSEISQKIFFISINASVEAARAGENGLGFSVIASEIRTLAQEAQTAIEAY